MRLAAPVAALVGLALAGPALSQDGDGEELFEDYCAACHNSGGIGTPGLAPPLDRPDFWAALGESAPTYIAGVMTKGFLAPITVRGERYIGMPMVAVDEADEDLAAVATWVLTSLGGLDLTVTAGQVGAMRESDMDHAGLKALRPKTE